MKVKEYYAVLDQKRIGPLSLDELSDLELSKNTLVWYKGMEAWRPISEISSISYLVDNLPPPMPFEQEQEAVEVPYSEKEIAAAKEIMSISQLFMWSLIVAVLSFPIFYFVVYEATKFDDFERDGSIRISGNQIYGIKSGDFPFALYGGGDNITMRSNVDRRKIIYTKRSIGGAFSVFVGFLSIFVLVRYFQKGKSWVEERIDYEEE